MIIASSLSSVTIEGVDKIFALPDPASAFKIPPKPLLSDESKEPVAKLTPLLRAFAMFDASPVVADSNAGIAPLKLVKPIPLPPLASHWIPSSLASLELISTIIASMRT